MFSFLKDIFWNLSCPWPHRRIEKSVRNLSFSICGEDRFGDCVNLYERNEAHGLPSSHRNGYLEALRSGRIVTLIAEEQGQVVGTFGLQYLRKPDVLILCYLLASPECHRSGVGTTMVFTSLALLPEHHEKLTLGVYALPHSLDFYRRFGFRPCAGSESIDGTAMTLAKLPVSCATSARCRALLAAANATLPAPPPTIPTPVRSVSTGENSKTST